MKLSLITLLVVLTTSAASPTLRDCARSINPAGADFAKRADGDDPQSSTTLLDSVIAKGFAQDGQQQNGSEPGQIPSRISTNNFINFCATTGQPITDGKQITNGSCNPAPMGQIPSTSNMPSCKFSFPQNMGTIQANTTFTVQMNIRNLNSGNFVNAETNYYSAPQQLDGNGLIFGHSHVVVEHLDSINSTTPNDPNKFVFFKGLNAAAQNGVLTADITNGLPEGVYKMSSINTASNHQPVLAPIAQHASLDDTIYFFVTQSGN